MKNEYHKQTYSYIIVEVTPNFEILKKKLKFISYMSTSSLFKMDDILNFCAYYIFRML